MIAPLDRPIWHALTGRQSRFAEARGQARRYAGDVSPFAAASDDGAGPLRDLASLIGADQAVVLLQAGASPLPPATVAEMVAEAVQMVAHRLVHPHDDRAVSELTDDDGPAMLELAALTRPGPFLPRTHRLGSFVGVRVEGRLVAMAGERMKLAGFTEVSGVCTHPEFRGRGYAGLLSQVVAARIEGRGETPFLHAYARNTGAIRLYEKLGFAHRAMMTVTVLRRGA